jgi:murein L,D-transpeptidase YafK
VDKVVVHKSANKMYLIKNSKPIKEYDIALGGNPVGHKMQEGDMRTPEGQYMLDYKNNRSKFYKSINISYPNSHDIIKAQLRGVSPGDDIVIHGLPNGMRDEDIIGELQPKNWTQGCIAVKNREMDEIWQLVEIDTPIEIRP